MDILGPFSRAIRQYKFLLVAIDYFTKWIKAEPLAHIIEAWVKDFVWKSIISQYGISNAIITDNSCQFSSAQFCKFCEEFGISQWFTSVEHLQANSKAKVTNRTLLQGLKAQLDQAKEY